MNKTNGQVAFRVLNLEDLLASTRRAEDMGFRDRVYVNGEPVGFCNWVFGYFMTSEG